ncbi:MAG: glycosyltransferase family 39 protein [Terriglobia bacterium]
MTGIREVTKTISKFLSLGLSLGWIVYVYHRNLPLISPRPFQDFLKSRLMGCFEMLLLLALWVAAYLIGARFIEFLQGPLEPGMERLSLAAASGFAILSLAVFLLAATHLLYRAATWSLLAFPILWWGKKLKQIPAEVWPHCQGVAEEQRSLGCKLGHYVLLAFIIMVLTVVLVSALGPAIEFDDLAYHLVSGKIYIQQHGLMPIPDNPITFLPKNIEMLFTLGMMLSSAVTAKLIHFLLGLLTILAAYALGLRFFGRSVALVAAAVLVSTPIFLWEMRVAHIDAGLALYTFLAVYSVVVWLKSQELAWLKLAIFFLAFSQGIKYHALFVLMSLTGAIIVFCWRHGSEWLEAGWVGLKFALYSCLGLLPWGAVNLVYTGNPLFPLLSNIIPTHYWDADLTKLITTQQKNAGIPFSMNQWAQWPVACWYLVTDPKNLFRGNIGPFYLALIPLLVFRRRLDYPVGFLLGFSLLYYLFWLFTAQHVRYLAPLLPGLSVVAAFSLVSFLERMGA